MNKNNNKDCWFIYLLMCKGGRTYTGITNNLIKRYKAHREGKGAKFTKAFPPIEMIGWEAFPDKSTAASAEYYFRRLSKAKKIATYR